MICPDCRAENIPGVDICVECGHDLRDLDVPTPTSGLHRVIMEDPISKLDPVKPICVAPWDSVSQVIDAMKKRKFGCALVVEEGLLVGIVTERDLLHKVAGKQQDFSKFQVNAIMTRDPVRLKPEDTIAYALYQMAIGGYRHIPIVSDNIPVGFISVRGILDYLAANL